MLLDRANAATAVICLVLATGCGLTDDGPESGDGGPESGDGGPESGDGGPESGDDIRAAADPGDAPEARRRCEPARSMAEDYEAPELVAAFETSVEAVRESRPPSSGYEDVDDGRVWLCYFSGPNPNIATSPPPSAEGEVAETFDRVSFLVTEDGAAHLASFSYTGSEPDAPPDSNPLQQPED